MKANLLDNQTLLFDDWGGVGWGNKSNMPLNYNMFRIIKVE